METGAYQRKYGNLFYHGVNIIQSDQSFFVSIISYDHHPIYRVKEIGEVGADGRKKREE